MTSQIKIYTRYIERSNTNIWAMADITDRIPEPGDTWHSATVTHVWPYSPDIKTYTANDDAASYNYYEIQTQDETDDEPLTWYAAVEIPEEDLIDDQGADDL